MSDNKRFATAQYLTLTLSDETFAIDISRVREVLEFGEVTQLPRLPNYMRGVINLRGKVVPLVDLNLKFGLGATQKSVNTCNIIVDVNAGAQSTVLGLMADAVQEVFTLDGDMIEPPPRIGSRLNSNFILGMGKRGDEFIILLDIDKIFEEDEIAALTSVETTPPKPEPKPTPQPAPQPVKQPANIPFSFDSADEEENALS